MAELVGLVASIGAIVGFAGTAAKLSFTLYNTARKAGSARKDIEEFANNASSFAAVIRLTHDSIQNLCRDNKQSHVLQYIQEHEVLEQINKQCVRIDEQISGVRPRIRSIRSDFEVVTRIKWYFRRQEVQELHPKMECVKSNLSLLVDVVHLELLGAREQTPETKAQIKRLKRQVKLQAKTIKCLLGTIDDLKHHGPFESHRNRGFAVFDEDSLMLDLAECMVERGHVPGETSSSISSGYFSTSGTGKSSTEGTNTTIQTSRDKGKSPEGRQPEMIATSSTTTRGDRTPSSTIEQPRGSSSMLIIRLHPKGECKLLQCTFQNLKGRYMQLLVMIDTNIDENVVSRQFVMQHSIPINILRDRRGVVIQSPNGQRKVSIEQAVVRWQNGKIPARSRAGTKEISVSCWVSEFELDVPIFGRLFSEEIEKYSGPSGS